MKKESALQYKYRGILSRYLESKRLSMARKWITGRYILDLGCCQAKLLDSEHNQIDYVGIDNSEELIQFNGRRYPAHSFINADLNKIPEIQNHLGNKKFSTVLLLAVIEHLDNPEHLMTFVTSLLSPNGRIIITTPHPLSEHMIDIGAKFRLFAKEGIDQHKPLMSRADLAVMADKLDLKLIHYKPFSFWLNQLIVFQNSAT